MTRKRIHWKKGKIQTYGDEGARRVKGSLLIEELDHVDETTLIKAMAPAMDWFVAPTNKEGTGGHGGPMIDTHSNEVIGHWDGWEIGVDDETGLKCLDLLGVVHKGPDEFGGEFPQADLAWNRGKAGKWKGLSWGGNKRSGYFEYDTKTGEVFGNTITRVLPFEVSIIDEGKRGPNGMPAIPAVPHSKIREMASVKMAQPGGYDDADMEPSSAIPEEWVSNCMSRMKWMGPDAKEMCQVLYMNSGSKVKEALGSEITTKELVLDLDMLRSQGTLPNDINQAVKESPLAQRFVALRALETSEKEALSDLQRVLDGEDKEVKTLPMDEETKKFLEEQFGAVSTEVKSLGDRVKAVEEKSAPAAPPAETPPAEGAPSAELKELQETVKSLTDKQAETQKSLDAATKELADLKAKQEPPEEEEEDEPASNEEEKHKKELEIAQKAQKEAEAKAEAAQKELEASKKSVAALSRKVSTPGPQRSRTLNEGGQAPPDGQGTQINPREFSTMDPAARQAAIDKVPVTPEKV